VDELRIELDDIKSALHSTQVELGLLDERIKKQPRIPTPTLSKDTAPASTQVVALERKISQVEKTLTKTSNDLRTLSTTIQQALSKIQTIETHLTSQEERLGEVAKLKGTLTSISKAIGQQRPGAEVTTTSIGQPYRVKAGDSLEKIAREKKVTVDALRKMNQLTQDKIFVGQNLRIPENGS
jgi:LysM repeat protein